MMPKDIHTPRDELVCGKLDAVAKELSHLGFFKANTEAVVRILDIVNDIRRDCERMEAKLILRKQEACEWIDVSDKLPAIGQKVILFGNGVVQEEIFILDAGDVSDYAPAEYFWSRTDLEDEDCPKVEPGQKWMPLPKSPDKRS